VSRGSSEAAARTAGKRIHEKDDKADIAPVWQQISNIPSGGLRPIIVIPATAGIQTG